MKLTKEKLNEMLAVAEANLRTLVEAFDDGNMNEEQFKWACDLATRCVIAKAAITSKEVMR